VCGNPRLTKPAPCLANPFNGAFDVRTRKGALD
jgi:hypothetical protein